MRSARFVCLFAILGSAMLAAQSNPVPLVNQPLVPASAAPGGPTFSLTVNGTGFVSGSVVDWNGTALDTTFVSDSRLAATVPASNIAVHTTAAITVANPSPGGGSSNPVFFPVSVPVNPLYFTNSQILTTDASPTSIAVGDFNRDGKLDLAVANNGSATVSIFLGNGDGTFQPKVDYATIASPVGITAADLRGDGILDLAVVTPGEISVLLGNGDGTFQPHVDYPGYSVGPLTLGGVIVAADFNADGKLDLAAAYGDVCDPACGSQRRRPPMLITQGFTSVFLGKGDGTFQPYISTSQAPGGQTAAAGDFNNDGRIDLASGFANEEFNSDSAVVGLGNGDGTFTISYSKDDGGLYDFVLPFVAAADFNGDGRLDFIICNGGSTWLLLGNGDGTFQTPIQTDGGCGSLAMGDFHGNGFLDLATPYAVFTGNGTGEFSESGDTILPNGNGNQAVWVSAADFNGDGKLDVVLANSNNTIWVDLQSVGAVVSLSPTSLNFGNQTVGITSTPQNVTLQNNGNVNLTITSIQTTGANSGDFSQTNNCPGSVPPNSGCKISVTFTPTAIGTRNAAVSISDNAPGSPQSVPFTGVGVLPAATFSPTSLTFPTQLAFSTSKAQLVQLTNNGLGILLIGKIAVSGPFSQTNNCPSSLNPGANCTISVRFHPKNKGEFHGAVSVIDNAPGSPQTVPLTGTGTFVQLVPTTLNFGTQPVGTRSLPKRITLTNKGGAAVNITSISITGINAKDFAETNTCGKSVASGASCFIKVTFKPLAKGKRMADVSVYDNGGGGPQEVGLTGTGT
jgi:hypothetical protein